MHLLNNGEGSNGIWHPRLPEVYALISTTSLFKELRHIVIKLYIYTVYKLNYLSNHILLLYSFQ